VYCSPFRSQATFVAKNRGDEVLDEEGIAAHSGIVFSEVEKFRLAQAKVRGDGWGGGGLGGCSEVPPLHVASPARHHNVSHGAQRHHLHSGIRLGLRGIGAVALYCTFGSTYTHTHTHAPAHTRTYAHSDAHAYGQ
jgi:hypothetical protein